MPIYEYQCTACSHRTDILHGIHESGPRFCPNCGAEGTMRKTITAPAIVFKGSGWAKKDRRPAPAASHSKSSGGDGGARDKSTSDSSSTSASSSTSGSSPKSASKSDTSSGSSQAAGPAASSSNDD